MISKSVKKSLEFDKENNNNLWRDSIHMKMTKINITVEENEGDPSDLLGYQEITGDMIFNVNMGDKFRHKARCVADGHKKKNTYFCHI